MHVTFDVTHLAKTKALYLPTYVEVEVLEPNNLGMTVTWTETVRQYNLFLPHCPLQIAAANDPNTAIIEAHPWTPYRPYLIAFLRGNNIPYTEANNVTESYGDSDTTECGITTRTRLQHAQPML